MSSESRQTFFRQSGWMVISTLTSGVFMFAVHVFGPLMGDTEYGLFGTLLGMMNLMTIPGLALQTTFAQQAAAATTEQDRDRLTATTRSVLLWMFLLWLAAAVIVGIFQQRIRTGLTISNPLALWISLAVALVQLWAPILLGILQGQQNFLWLGWANIINGLGRFIAIGVIVGLLGGLATGAVFGAWLGYSATVVIGFIYSRSVWAHKPNGSFDRKEWLGRILPLTLGLGAGQFLFSVDVVFVRALFGESGTGYYNGAGMIGRGLVVFTAPLAFVMFPKIVQSAAHGKKSKILFYTLVATFLLGAIAAACCTGAALFLKHIVTSHEPIRFLPPGLVAKLRGNPDGMGILATLLPWFVWCMLPLAVANVLLNNLLARKKFRVVLYLIALAIMYALCVRAYGTSFVRVIQILGIFNLLFVAVLAVFTWIDRKSLEVKPS